MLILKYLFAQVASGTPTLHFPRRLWWVLAHRCWEDSWTGARSSLARTACGLIMDFKSNYMELVFFVHKTTQFPRTLNVLNICFHKLISGGSLFCALLASSSLTSVVLWLGPHLDCTTVVGQIRCSTGEIVTYIQDCRCLPLWFPWLPLCGPSNGFKDCSRTQQGWTLVSADRALSVLSFLLPYLVSKAWESRKAQWAL